MTNKMKYRVQKYEFLGTRAEINIPQNKKKAGKLPPFF
jgi:hypothetical protein